MSRQIRIALVVCAAVALGASVLGADEGHARVRLVADAASLEPGAPFRLGVRIEPDPGWHVYWRNPGGAGLATEVLYELPDGFEVGELRWPAPVAFEQPGGIPGYGYEDPVVLAAEVTPPAGVGTTAPVAIAVSWLACRDICVLGSARLAATLPLTPEGREASTRWLERWAARLPTETDSAPFEISVTGGPVPEAGRAELAVWLRWPDDPGTVEFFPDPGPGLKVADVRTRTRGRLTRIDLTISRLKTAGDAASALRSLIVHTDDGDRRIAVETLVDID